MNREFLIAPSISHLDGFSSPSSLQASWTFAYTSSIPCKRDIWGGLVCGMYNAVSALLQILFLLISCICTL